MVNDWTRVSVECPCPICGKPDWCLVTGPTGSPSAAICPRIESEKWVGDAGYLHVLDTGKRAKRPLRRFFGAPYSTYAIDFPVMARALADQITPSHLERMSRSLGVSEESLISLGVGWHDEASSYAIPMRNARTEVVGIHLRSESGHKWAVTGSRAALFIPSDLDDRLMADSSRMVVAEGASDAAALLDLGFAAIGRPSAMQGVHDLASLARAIRPSSIVICADADRAGATGAQVVYICLAPTAPDMRIVTPPGGFKDIREWVRGGATTEIVNETISMAKPDPLALVFRRNR